MKKCLIAIVFTLVLSAFPVYAKDASKKKPLATYEWEDGKVDLVKYKIKNEVIGLVLDYTNTTDENVSPGWQIAVNLFQDGIEMEAGRSFDIKGVKSEYKEIRPGATLRFAEFFELESMDPVEVELSPVFSYDDPFYVTLDLDTKEVTESTQEKAESKKKNKSGNSSSGSSWLEDAMDVYSDAYEDVMDVYTDAYEDVMDEYSNALDDVLGSLGF